MRKMKLLVIAPYEGLKSLMEGVIQKRQDIEADIYSASLEQCVELVSRLDVSAYDVIMSRGTTGKMLQKAINRWVVDIETTILDIIRAMQLVQNALDQYAFVGFPKFINQVNLYCEVMHINAEAYSIDSVEEAQRTIESLKDKGTLFIIGDGIAVDIAKSLGMGSILVTSGEESVNMAINNAVTYYRTERTILTKYLLLDRTVDLLKQTIVIFDETQNVVYQKECGNYTHALQARLQTLIPVVLKQGERCFYEAIEDAQFKIMGKATQIEESNYVFFCATRSVRKQAANREPYSIEDFNGLKLNNNLSLYNSSSAMTAILSEAKNCIAYSLPILILGEPGCGKDTLAYTLYAQGQNRNGLFVTIDCSSLHKQDWQYLINREDSPLYENGNCIYFKDASSLSLSLQQEMCDFMQSTALVNRNQVIASVCKSPDQTSESAIIYPLQKLLGDITLYIPPLRERIKELPGIAACYINEINQQLPKQVIGFEEEALNFLKGYDWPNNIDQLKQVIKESILRTDASYITVEDVRLVLDQMQARSSASGHASAQNLDLDKPLSEIEKDVISIVLQKNGMNQSLAAKALGISRGTLWRKLKE